MNAQNITVVAATAQLQIPNDLNIDQLQERGPREAIEYLIALDPDGYHHLDALDPETGYRAGRTFSPGARVEMEAWIRARILSRNLYFTANEPSPDASNKKLSKEDIATIRCVYADVDPSKEPGTDFAAEQARLDDIVAQNASGMWPATMTAHSGNGRQLLWVLERKLPVVEYRDWAEAQGKAIGRALAGDHVQNIDRVLRLPGTLNIPTPAKLKLGRGVRRTSTTRLATFRYSPEELSRQISPVDRREEQHPEFERETRAELESNNLREVPPELAKRFGEARLRCPRLNTLWRGEADGLFGSDGSGSGYRASLARHMAETGFAAADYGRMVLSWNIPQVDPHKIDPDTDKGLRQLVRDWANCGRPHAAAQWFDPPHEPLFPEEQPTIVPAILSAATIQPVPYDFPVPADIPRRQTLYGGHYTRQFVSVTVAPTKVGKSSLIIAEALAMASGKPLLGVKPIAPLRVWLWNGEDPLEETRRRVAAAMMHYELKREDLCDEHGRSRLMLGSGRDTEIVLASSGRDGTKISEPVADAVTAAIRSCSIDVLIVDPFVSSHRVSENDNGAVDVVAKRWARIADKTGSAVELVHHVRKLGGAEATIEDGRGASSLIAASRSARALSKMTAEEERRRGLSEGAHHRYFRISDSAANLGLPTAGAACAWFELASVALGNGEGSGADRLLSGDSVGVVTRADLATAENAVPDDDFDHALRLIGEGEWRQDVRSGDAWVGHAIGKALSLDATDPAHRGRISAMLKKWIADGVLVVEHKRDKKSNTRAFITVAPRAPFHGPVTPAIENGGVLD